MSVRILVGDVRERLRDLEPESVQCVVTSPPYFGLRDYGTAQWDGGDPACDHRPDVQPRAERSNPGGSRIGNGGTYNDQQDLGAKAYRDQCRKCGAVRVDRQIGLEATLAEYVETLVAVFRDVRRVLRLDGVVFCNLGDSYAGSWGNQGRKDERGTQRPINGPMLQNLEPYPDAVSNTGTIRDAGLKPKDLMMVPARVALALQDDGWWLRSDIIWAKRNCMPESVQGSQYVRHRVTISDYERLSGLRYEGERNGQSWPSYVPDVQACEIPGSEAPVSAEREGQGDGAGSGRTRGRAGETPAVQSFSAGQEEQSEVRGYAEGQGDASEGDSSIPSERQGENQRRGILPANQERSTADSSSGAGKCEIRQVRGYESQEAARLRETPASDCAGSSSNSDGLVGDRAAAQASLPLLRGTNDANSRSRDTSQQRRAARQREPRASVPELQFSEEQQTDSALLVDCPGCPKCEANDGYILRMNAGRPTSSHEHIFLLTKSARYYYDAEAVRETLAETNAQRTTTHYNTAERYGANNGGNSGLDGLAQKMRAGDVSGRNQRNVWHLATEPFPDAHFATFPTEIPRRCIKAGTSEKGQCPACGAPWVRVVERPTAPDELRNRGNGAKMDFHTRQTGSGQKLQNWYDENPPTTTGWQPSCTCDAGDPVPQTVLDPFAGSGTTLLVADQLGRHGVGIELSPEYAAMAEQRVRGDAPMFAEVTTL